MKATQIRLSTGGAAGRWTARQSSPARSCAANAGRPAPSATPGLRARQFVPPIVFRCSARKPPAPPGVEDRGRKARSDLRTRVGTLYTSRDIEPVSVFGGNGNAVKSSRCGKWLDSCMGYISPSPSRGLRDRAGNRQTGRMTTFTDKEHYPRQRLAARGVAPAGVLMRRVLEARIAIPILAGDRSCGAFAD